MSNAIDYRIQIIGHEQALDLLKRQHQGGRLPQSLLITGAPNIGKSTLACFFAQYLNCQGEDKPCGRCLSCRKTVSGNHPDTRILDGSESLKIDQVRTLQRELALSPVEGRHRAAILCNFERATTEAANALLKTLEEPASQVVLILTATEAGNLLPTIVSRCQILKVRPLAYTEVLNALQSYWHVEPEQAELLTQLSAGRLGWAVNALTDKDFLERRKQRFDDMLDLLRMQRAERLSFAAALSQDIAVVKEALVLWLTLWRDLLLLKSGAQTKIVNLDWQEALNQLAHQCTIGQALETVARLQSAYYNLDRNVNTRLNLEVVLLRLPRYNI